MRRPPVFGTKKTTQTQIAGPSIEKEFSIFIGGINNEIDENQLWNYIVKEHNINPIKITLNRVNPYNRSFKSLLSEK